MIPQWIREHNERADSYGGFAGLAGLSGALKNVYAAFRTAAFPKLTPLLAQVRKQPPTKAKWGGQGVFFDVVVSRHLPQDHLYVLPDQGTIVVPNLTLKRSYVSLNLPVIPNVNRGMVTGITLL